MTHAVTRRRVAGAKRPGASGGTESQVGMAMATGGRQKIRMQDGAVREIVLSAAMKEHAVALMVAWDDPDAKHDLGTSYGSFLERLFRETLAVHRPPIAVRTDG